MARRLTEAQQSQVEANRGLAYRFAYIASRRYPAASGEDLLSAAMIGLCRAAMAFDPARGRFSTVAWGFMLNEIQVCLRESQIIRTPAHTHYKRKGGDSKYTVHARAIRTMSRHSIGGNMDIEQISPPEENAETEHQKEQIHRAMQCLDTRLQTVLVRTVMGGETLRAVSVDLGCTKERVRQLRLEGLAKLRGLMGIAL